MKFIMARTERNGFQATLAANNGASLMFSELAGKRARIKTMVESAKLNANKPERWDYFIDRKGEHYAALKAGNGQVTFVTKKYARKSSMDRAIKRIQSTIEKAIVIDRTWVE